MWLILVVVDNHKATLFGHPPPEKPGYSIVASGQHQKVPSSAHDWMLLRCYYCSHLVLVSNQILSVEGQYSYCYDIIIVIFLVLVPKETTHSKGRTFSELSPIDLWYLRALNPTFNDHERAEYLNSQSHREPCRAVHLFSKTNTMSALPKKVVCIGAGYVGGPTMAMIALKCPDIEVRKFACWSARTPGPRAFVRQLDWGYVRCLEAFPVAQIKGKNFQLW